MAIKGQEELKRYADAFAKKAVANGSLFAAELTGLLAQCYITAYFEALVDAGKASEYIAASDAAWPPPETALTEDNS